MNNDTIRKYAVNFARSRSNLLLVVAFTTINLFLAIAQSDFFLLFSATLPTLVFAVWGVNAANIAIAFGMVLFYCLCWVLAKRTRAFILAALVFFSIDTAVFLYLVVELLAYADAFLFIEIAFHVWIMFYLITGTIAWHKLRNINAESIDAARANVAAQAAEKEADEALKNLNPNPNPTPDEKRDDNE